MAKYLLQVSYTLDGIRGLKAQGGSARRAAADEAVKSVGGTTESFYFAFGDTDVYLIADLPDNAAAAALALAVASGGGATVQTVTLLTADDLDAAAKKGVTYRPPGS